MPNASGAGWIRLTEISQNYLSYATIGLSEGDIVWAISVYGSYYVVDVNGQQEKIRQSEAEYLDAWQVKLHEKEQLKTMGGW